LGLTRKPKLYTVDLNSGLEKNKTWVNGSEKYS